MTKIIDQVQEVLRELPSPDPESLGLAISDRRLRKWMSESNAAEICDSLDLKGTQRHLVETRIVALQELNAAVRSDLSQALSSIGRVKFAIGDAKSEERARTGVAKELAQQLRSLPGDAIFLSSLGEGIVGGFVAYLRRVREVSDRCVVRSMGAIPFDARYVRVSRLSALYVYALTHQLANVFSAIGLPQAYEEHRAMMLESVLNLNQDGQQ